MDEPEAPKLSQSLETLIETGLFNHLSDETQNEIILNLIIGHDKYAEKVSDYYERLKP